MSTILLPDVDYPTGDGKPIAETPIHRVNLTDSIAMLECWFAGRKDVYISGNMLMYHAQGDPRRRVSPDVFVVLGVPRDSDRRCYKTWFEPKPTLDFVIEFTSKSTQNEDQIEKFELYRTVLAVREFCLFDPAEEYLEPSSQLFRLIDGEYVPVAPVEGRLPSQVLNLHIDREGHSLRFWDPATGEWLPNWPERIECLERRTEQERQRAERFIQERRRLEQERLKYEKERQRADESQALEARLQAELDALRKERGRETK